MYAKLLNEAKTRCQNYNGLDTLEALAKYAKDNAKDNESEFVITEKDLKVFREVMEKKKQPVRSSGRLKKSTG